MINKFFYLKTILLFSVALLLGCSQKNINQEDKYIIVDAMRKLYHSDGARSYTEYEPFETRIVKNLGGYKIPEKPKAKSRYGGWKERAVTPTGFFHVKKIDGRWWGVDPEGYLYVNIALNSINQGRSDRNREAFAAKFGSSEKWIDTTVKMLEQYGYNCAGSWSDHNAITKYNMGADYPFAYTINWNFMSGYGRERGGTYQLPGHTGYPNNAIFVFDPEFKEYCDNRAKQLLEYKDDPNLFGYFSDNEMPFRLSALDDFLKLPEDDHGYIAAKEWLSSKEIYKENIDDNSREDFLAYVAETYFSIVKEAINRYDPHHMYLGTRFYSGERNIKKFMETAGKYLDIISINYYNYWTPNPEHMSNFTKWSDKPFIITEYYTKGEDSGMPNQSGAGWIVKTQKDRGLFYQNFNLALIESKNCVGWHYFKYQDNDPTAKGVDPSNIDANKGIVDNYYEVWTDVVEEMTELNSQVYDLIEFFDTKNREKK